MNDHDGGLCILSENISCTDDSQCVSSSEDATQEGRRYLEIDTQFSSSKINGWGGPRANSGGPRPNSGGPRPNSGGARPNSGPKPRPVIEAPPDTEERWYCCRTEYNQDLLADIQLRLAGFTIFAPTIWKAATPAKRDANGVVRPAKPSHITSLFKGYLFVRFCKSNPEWRRILSLPGIDRIISSTPENPIPVLDSAIDIVRSYLAPNGCYYPGEEGIRLAALTPGTKVRMESGPMANLVGICEKSDGRRVKILLEILGRTVSVTAAQSAVEVVGSELV